MIEAIEVAGLDPTKLMPANNPVQQAQASPIDVRGFSEALRNAGVDSANPTPSVTVANPSEGTKALVAALDNLSSGASSVSDIAQRIAQNPDAVKPSDMIELTHASHEFMFKSTITSNVANRTSDGIQQLFRQQS